jgi:hypothetical protein
LVVGWLRQLEKPPYAGGRKRLGECRDVALAYMRSRRKSVKRLLTTCRIRRRLRHFKADRKNLLHVVAGSPVVLTSVQGLVDAVAE